MRSLATLKNSIWGILQQVIVCILSLFSRRVMIDTIGVEGVGLNALLTSVITMLSLAELGIGTAIVYHMYAPIAANDQKQIARLMHTYHRGGDIFAGSFSFAVHAPHCLGYRLFRALYPHHLCSVFAADDLVLSFYLQALDALGRSKTVYHHHF